MCGIAGIFDYSSAGSPLNESVGLRMVQQLMHRGPDDGCLLVAPRILLGHRRLSILDLTERGRQPMSDEQGRCWISFNGEIYNFRDLRNELERSGQRFQSECDTEVILRGYLQWGPAVAERLNGMFAFAIWDTERRSLWLARDPIGIKPLYYYDNGERLWFASEIKSLLADPAIPRRPDWCGLDTFLTFGYVGAPFTGFAGIQQLLPGHSLLAVQGSATTGHRWFRLPYPQSPTSWTLTESVERLDTAIQNAVQRQMVSDVPLGALLSGGLDSSAVVRAARTSTSLDTFTIGFDEASFDERPYAAAVAAHYHTRHHAQCVQASAEALLPLLAAHAEEPFADNSMLPFYLLSQFVRQHVTVALSGDGADELLAGYDTYRASELAPYYRALPRWLRRGIIRPLVQQLPASTRKYSRSAMLQRFVYGADAPPLRAHCSWRHYLTEDLKGRLYTTDLQQSRADPLQQYTAAADDAPDWLSPLERQMLADLRFHLPNDILVKADRMSMAHSLEVRVPLLDLEVVKVCLAIPAQWKRHRGRGKWVLRQMLAADLPPDVLHRKKAGFLIPLEKWLREEWQPLLRTHVNSSFADSTGVFQWPVLKAMIDDHAAGKRDYAYPLFALLMLSLWWKNWIDGSATDACRFQVGSRVPAATRIHRLTLPPPESSG